MKRKILIKLFSIFLLLGTSVPIFGIDTPAAGDGKWYYIKSQRGASANECWWTVGDEGYVATADLSKQDSQMFTLVEASEGKVTFVNKAANFTMSYAPDDARKHMKFVDETPVSEGWTLTSNVVKGVQGWSFPGEVTGLHQSNGPGAPDHFRVMGTWYNLEDNCTFFFYEATTDIELKLAIESAKTVYNNATVGVAPGAYPTDAKNVLGSAIETAENVIGSTDETTIQDAISTLESAIATFESSKVKLAASTPAVDDGKWYYIKSLRSSNPGFFWTLAADDNAKPIPSELTKADNQKFTLVSVDNKVKFKSFDGRESSDDFGFNTEGATTQGWTLTSQTTQVPGVQGWSFPGVNAGLHQGNAGWNWEVRAGGWYSVDDFCTFYFFEASEDIDLLLKIEEASKIVSTAEAGETPGSTPQSAIDQLGAAIGAANATLGSTDATEIEAAVALLSEAITTFNTSVIPLVEASTEADPKWYLIKNMGRGGIGGTLFVDKMEGQMAITSVENSIPADGSGTEATAASLAHLFRFEIDADGKYEIINALFPEGEILQAETGGNSSNAINYGIDTAETSIWKLVSLGFKNDKYQFNMISNNLTNCHASGSLKLVSWDDAADSPSAWYAEEFTGNVTDLYQVAYETAKAKIDTVKVKLPSGTEFFQATEEGLDALNEAQDRLTAAYNEGVPTADFNASIAAVDGAIVNYWATLQFPFSTSDEPVWCVIQSVGNNERVIDALMSKEPDTELLRGVLPAEVPTDSLITQTLFRFEKNEMGKIAIINHDSTSITTAGFETSFKFTDQDSTFFGWDIVLEMGDNHTFGFLSGPAESININNSDNENVRYYTNYFAGGIADKGNQFKIYPFDHYFQIPTPPPPSGIEDVDDSVRPININGTIVVGDLDVEVYSATGVKIQNANLKSGIYLVKTAGKTYKVGVN